eukprot:314243-Rhodomonas_salina.2
MAMEFARELRWTDSKGAHNDLCTEWAYVHGLAARREGCSARTRDEDNNGVSLAEFRSRANKTIQERRARFTRSGRTDAEQLPEAAALLSEEEVAEVRLYSGPSFLPLNAFLRQTCVLQVAACSGEHRQALASHPLLSFAATCRLLSSAVRKLSAAPSPEEAALPLWRGVRGELSASFWTRDEQGMVCAVDTAFMSTSRRRQTPLDYIDPHGPNVLWELRPSTESDVAYRQGADISMLSQFAAEAEVLFPPCTMLLVVDPPPTLRDTEERLRRSERAGAGAGAGLSSDERVESGCRFRHVRVVPSFV